MDLGREVAVERAEGDVGLLGHGAHLDRVEAALGGQRDGRVEDALAAVPLRGGPEVLDRERVRGDVLTRASRERVRRQRSLGLVIRLPTAGP